MDMHELLFSLTNEDLKELARINEIKGFSGLKKEDLAGLIYMNLYTMENSLQDKFEGLPDSQKYFLTILAKNTSGTNLFNKIKSEFLQKYSSSTYYSALENLRSLALIFAVWDEEKQDDLLVIPSDFLSKIRKMTKELRVNIKEEEQEEEKEEIKDVRDILNYITKEELSWFCEDNNLAKSGTKEQIINRIMESKINISRILDIPSKPILQEVCEILGLKISGRKEELKQSIIEKLNLKPKTKAKAPKQKKGIIPVPVLNDSVVDEQETEVKSETIERDELINYLKLQRPAKPRDEMELGRHLEGLLKGHFGEQYVRTEKTAKGGSQRFDIILWDKVVIELKVTDSKTKVKGGLGQIADYLQQNSNYKYGILIIYDISATRNLCSQFPAVYFDKIYFIFW